MCIQSAAVIVQFAVNAGKVEIQHQVTIAVICGMLPYVEIAKQGIKLVNSVAAYSVSDSCRNGVDG